MKREETKEIEALLLNSCFAPNNPSLAKEYGCEEVTIGFQRDYAGHERLDFLSYDAKENIFRCYEIKVTMEDLKSDAKFSWYGHYNYLVISKGLYLQKPLDWWKKQVPDFVGIIVAYPKEEMKKAIKKAKKIEIDKGQEEMLKKSLIRSLFYKNSRLVVH